MLIQGHSVPRQMCLENRAALAAVTEVQPHQELPVWGGDLMCFGRRYLTFATAGTLTFESLAAASTTNGPQDHGVHWLCVSAALAALLQPDTELGPGLSQQLELSYTWLSSSCFSPTLTSGNGDVRQKWYQLSFPVVVVMETKTNWFWFVEKHGFFSCLLSYQRQNNYL